MKLKIGAAIAVIFLGLAAGAANAKPSLAPSIVSSDDADKTIVIKDRTKHINVFANETILFKVGDQQFAIKFDGVSHEYDLAKIAPAGMLSHKVRVYVAPDPTDHEQGIP